MAVTCRTVMRAMEGIAPVDLAERWDNVGLQVGDPDKPVHRILVALDLLEEVACEAVENKADMVITHHPLIMEGVKSLREDSFVGRVASLLIKHGIALYCAHTNLDIVAGGINDLLAEKLALREVRPLSPTRKINYNKIVVYVPAGYENSVRDAMAEAGAGWIGNYSHCTFQTKGTGTFMPREGANPFLGTRGELEKVEEYRLETIVPEELTFDVVKAMLKAHPYEEVAYDIYRLENERGYIGIGRIGILDEPVVLEEFAGRIKQVLGLEYTVVCGPLDREVRRVALCSGSGGSLIDRAAAMGADVYISGDIKYHQAHHALGLNIAVIDPGHYHTEKVSISFIKGHLERELGGKVEVIESKINTNPFVIL